MSMKSAGWPMRSTAAPTGWAQNGGATLTHGWKPESGFLPYRWKGYDEALLLYVLGLGSPTYPLPERVTPPGLPPIEWKNIYGHEYLYSGPLFTHQLSHLWIDFRGIQDAFMCEQGDRLLREQPAGDLRTPAIRDP